ncbi:isoamyl alcohol oxidase [Crepidotus variabilis]|uniref:Isoamyl alcohol oxidase n=1 Tax=Crepidotus variabilis TaxID=179855 RepID=A0A9P6EQG1_9AGAR|nr:isoamyl alcohol oxidase [Crepidotus variabilis]
MPGSPSLSLWSSVFLAITLAQAQNITWTTGAPTTQDWKTLNSTVAGRLYAGVPWAEPCFSLYNGNNTRPDAAQCSFVQQNYFNNHMVRTSVFAGYGPQNFEACMATSDQCMLNWMNPTDPAAFTPPQDCKQGSIPDYYIDVRQASDVSTAFQFVAAKKIPLVIKNSGHDFQGRASGPGSLALWVHNLKSITNNANFIPEGCSYTAGKTALTVGAGSQFQDIYQYAHDNKLIFVGGSDQSVTATGGWGQGGGHSSLSRLYGMGVDNALQYKVVTPDGVLRTANACQNQDLFWALRGGGGSTFGVVLEGTMQVYPDQSFQIANIIFPIGNLTITRGILSIFTDNATLLATQKWGGYLTPTNGELVLLNPTLSTKDAQNSVDALSKYAISVGGKATLETVPSFLTWFQGWVQGTYGTQDPIGLPQALASRIVPQANHATPESRAQLVDALMDAVNSSFFQQIHFATPYGYNATSASDTSVNPIWRSSLYQIITVNTWQYNDNLATKKATYANTTQSVATLRSITPTSGAYANEADIHEPDWQTSFWGSNYPKLLSIKNKYDPNHLLDCWHCVGWTSATDPRYKCYI